MSYQFLNRGLNAGIFGNNYMVTDNTDEMLLTHLGKILVIFFIQRKINVYVAGHNQF